MDFILNENNIDMIVLFFVGPAYIKVSKIIEHTIDYLHIYLISQSGPSFGIFNYEEFSIKKITSHFLNKNSRYFQLLKLVITPDQIAFKIISNCRCNFDLHNRTW